MQALWLVILGAGALLIRVGFAWQASGAVRAKNAAGAVMRLVAESGFSVICFWAVGAAILVQQKHDFFWIDHAMLFGQSPEIASNGFFHMAIFLIGGAIVAGALAERAKFYVGIAASVALVAFIMPVAGHWVWNGWLQTRGFVDVAGASVIHVAAAVCAAIGAMMVGPRMGKYNKDGSSNSIPGHALPMTSVATLLMLAGWFPYVLGCILMHKPDLLVDNESLLGVAGMNVVLAAAAGAIVGLMYGQFRYGKPDVFVTFSGLVGGLVAISAGALTMGNIGALVTGGIAGLIVPLMAFEVDMRWHIDDPTGVIAAHGFGGIWGILAAALFAATPGTDKMKLFGVQAMGLAAIIALSAVVSLIVFLLVKVTGGLRASEPDEFDGLDLGEHDINAYPDFQQTTIKSYHLREA